MTRSFRFNKLVRDKIPDIIGKKSINLFDRILEPQEYIKELKVKLLEEAQEVASATSAADIIQELADVIEVVHALASAYGIKYDQIENQRIEKKEANGGFEKRIYGSYVEMDANNKNIEYYIKRSEKYPEIL